MPDPFVEATQQATPTNKMDAVDDEILRQLRRSLTQAIDDAVDNGLHRFSQRGSNLLRRHDERSRQASREIATLDLGVELVGAFPG